MFEFPKTHNLATNNNNSTQNPHPILIKHQKGFVPNIQSINSQLRCIKCQNHTTWNPIEGKTQNHKQY